MLSVEWVTRKSYRNKDLGIMRGRGRKKQEIKLCSNKPLKMVRAMDRRKY